MPLKCDPLEPASQKSPLGLAVSILRRVATVRCQLLAPSVTAWAHTAFPELRADRPYHLPGDDSRP
jgi:hypothetical protein